MCALFGWLDYKGIVPYKVLKKLTQALANACLLYTSDAADDLLCVDLGGRRIIKKKKQKTRNKTRNYKSNNNTP